MEDQWTVRVSIVCVTMLLLALMAALLWDCQKTDERRIECVKLGHSPGDCKRMLSSTDNY